MTNQEIIDFCWRINGRITPEDEAMRHPWNWAAKWLRGSVSGNPSLQDCRWRWYHAPPFVADGI